jgi:hypothetical protein
MSDYFQEEYIWLVIIVIALYFLLNIYGTYYYIKLSKLKHVSDESKTFAFITVILGWFFLPFLNFVSPILYFSHKK